MHFTTEIPFNIEQYATYAHVSPLRLNLSFDVHTFGIVMDSLKGVIPQIGKIAIISA